MRHGIQAMDLLGRKVVADGGQRLTRYLALIREDIERFKADAVTKPIAARLERTIGLVRRATDSVLTKSASDANQVGAVAAPFLRLILHLSLGWMWARMASIASAHQKEAADPFYAAKIVTASYYLQRVWPEVHTLSAVLESEADLLRTTDTF